MRWPSRRWGGTPDDNYSARHLREVLDRARSLFPPSTARDWALPLPDPNSTPAEGHWRTADIVEALTNALLAARKELDEVGSRRQ